MRDEPPHGAFGPEITTLERELSRLRERVAEQRSNVVELRASLREVAFQGIGLLRRWALFGGFLAGVAGAVGLVYVVNVVREILSGPVP